MFSRAARWAFNGVDFSDHAVRQYLYEKFIRVFGKERFSIPAATPEFFRQLPIFSGESYLRLNPDLPRSIDPYWHVSSYGIFEGRRMFLSETVQTALASIGIQRPVASAAQSSPSLKDRKFLVLVSSLGNFFMRELAERLVLDLRGAGAIVDLGTENSRFGKIRGRTCVIVAPHEFFLLGFGAAYWRRRLGQFDFYAFNTEQPQTQWFSQCFRYLMLARGILDLSPNTAEVLRRGGFNVQPYTPAAENLTAAYEEFMPGEHPLLAGYPDLLRIDRKRDVFSANRPLALSFIGGPSERRERFFAESAGVFSRWRSVIDYRKNLRGPIAWNRKNRHEVGLGHFLARHSRIYLNIHREDFGFFEIHRMVMQGMANGATVVTDHCLPHPDFLAGQHYLQEDLGKIPSLLEWLLESSEGLKKREQVAFEGHEAYKRIASADRTGGVLARFFCGAAQ